MIATWGALPMRSPWPPLRLIASAALLSAKLNGFQQPYPRHPASLRRLAGLLFKLLPLTLLPRVRETGGVPSCRRGT